MKEWFKARNIWGAAILALSDAEAGRLAKALWSYTMGGEEQNLSGAEKGIFAMILMTLSQDEDQANDLSRKRSEAGAKGGNQRAANQANATFASEDVASQAIACNKNKNKNKNIEEDNREREKEKEKEKEKPVRRFTPPTPEEVKRYCTERRNGVDADRFVDFYESKGWKVGNQPMKDWKACVRTWEREDRTRTGTGRQNSGKQKSVNAQQYGQRDYTGEQDEALETFLRMNGGV